MLRSQAANRLRCNEPIRVEQIPGKEFRYSGGGYVVVQMLLMDVTRKTFPELMDELVIQPLGITHSTFEVPLRKSLYPEAAKPCWRVFVRLKPGQSLPRMRLVDRMKYYGVPGVSIAVFDSGQILWARGYGLADISANKFVTPETLFQAASISKSVTAFGSRQQAIFNPFNLDVRVFGAEMST